MKRLIINADDFGFTRDVNAGILYAHVNGVLTATTLMANGDAFDDAVRLARATPSLDVGCHLVLVQGQSLLTGDPLPSKPVDLVRAFFQRKLDVYSELRAQIVKIIAAGIRPSHLDAHKHTHIVPAVFRQVIRLAEEFQIPFVRLPIDKTIPCTKTVASGVERFFRRLAEPYRVRFTDHFVGFRLTGSLTESTLSLALRNLPDGTTELMCHPGYLGHELSNAATRLKTSRAAELEALTSPKVKALMDAEAIRLATFREAADHR